MSVQATIAKLAQVLATIDPETGAAPNRIYEDPAEAVSLAEFPVIVIGYSPQGGGWREEALGLMRHDYALTIWIFLGARQTGLPELHSRALPWPDAIAPVLAANLTLGYVVNQIGSEPGGELFDYRVGPIPWAQANQQQQSYWGITVTLPVTEKINMEMGAGT